jgi:hypothetical protein
MHDRCGGVEIDARLLRLENVLVLVERAQRLAVEADISWLSISKSRVLAQK